MEERFGEAVATLEEAARRTRRQDPEVLHLLAWALFRTGRQADAAMVVREALDLLPDSDAGRRDLEATVRRFAEAAPPREGS